MTKLTFGILCTVILSPFGLLNATDLQDRDQIYQAAYESGLIRPMHPVGRPHEVAQQLEINDNSFGLAVYNIRSEYTRALIPAKVWTVHYLEGFIEGTATQLISPNIIRTLPLFNAKQEIAAEYVFIKFLRDRDVNTEEFIAIQQHLSMLESHEAYQGNEQILKAISASFDPNKIDSLRPRWENDFEKIKDPKKRQDKIYAFLPENLPIEKWEMWFESRHAILEGIKRALKLYQDEKELPILMTFQELTSTLRADLEESFPENGFVSYSAQTGHKIEHLTYDLQENKGPDNLGQLNTLMYDKKIFTVLETKLAYISKTPDIPSGTPGGIVRQKNNIAMFEIQHNLSKNSCKIFNAHISPKVEAHKFSWEFIKNFIHRNTANQTECYILVMDANLYPDATGPKGYRYLTKNSVAQDWRELKNVPYFSHPAIANTTFIGMQHDAFKNIHNGEEYEPRPLDMGFFHLKNVMEIIAVINEGIPLNITAGQVILPPAGHSEEGKYYIDHHLASDHTLKIFLMQPKTNRSLLGKGIIKEPPKKEVKHTQAFKDGPVSLPSSAWYSPSSLVDYLSSLFNQEAPITPVVSHASEGYKAFSQLIEQVKQEIACPPKDAPKWYIYSLEDMLEDMLKDLGRSQTLTKQTTKDYKKRWVNIKKDFDIGPFYKQNKQPTYSTLSPFAVSELQPSRWQDVALMNTTSFLSNGTSLLALKG